MDPVTVRLQTVRMEAHTQDPDNRASPVVAACRLSVPVLGQYAALPGRPGGHPGDPRERVPAGGHCSGHRRRIWDVRQDRRRQSANFSNGLRSYNAGFGLNYTAGGIECNYPLAHSPTTRCRRELSTARYVDGSAAVICGEYERIWRTRWSVAYVLHPERALIELRVRIYNRTAMDARYMYWNNCGFVLNEGCEYIFPETSAAMHGMEQQTFSWPRWRHLGLSQWQNTPPEMLGLYFLDAREPFFGYYDHTGDFGLVHYADLADVPGKKHWTWGTHAALIEHYRKTHHADGEVYGEVQSGRIVIQEHLDRLPPESESAWSEFWYPVRGTGSFNGAGPGAALRLEMLEDAAGPRQARARIAANGSFPGAEIVLEVPGQEPLRRPLRLGPTKTVTVVLPVPAAAAASPALRAVVRDRRGGILAEARLRPPNTRDAWLEVTDPSRTVRPATVGRSIGVPKPRRAIGATTTWPPPTVRSSPWTRASHRPVVSWANWPSAAAAIPTRRSICGWPVSAIPIRSNCGTCTASP